ncbi:MAG: ECF transporter S component [Halanaerobiaceae bacterium]
MNTKNLVYTAFFIALGIVLPMVFHLFAGGGSVFLPMHIPVLLAGVLLGPESGLITGILTPLLSSIFTGMPPVLPVLPIMIIELALYGFSIAILIKKFNIYISLIISIIIGRIGAGLVVTIMVHLFNFKLPSNPLLYLWGTITTGLPGIIIQLVFIPLLYKILRKYIDLKTVNLDV